MEFTIGELSAIVAIIGGIVMLYLKLIPIAQWRATTDAKIERLEEGKGNLFDKLEALDRKIEAKLDALDRKLDERLTALDNRLDEHERGCAEWRGRMEEKLNRLEERRT